jgi:hypothetical protein
MMDLVRQHILLKDIFRIIFEKLYSEWLKNIWGLDGDTITKDDRDCFLI